MGRLMHRGKPRNQSSPLACHIGIQLLKLRQKHQVTMREVGDQAGISTAYICEIENGQRSVGAAVLWKLSQAFDVPIGYWFKGYTEEGE